MRKSMAAAVFAVAVLGVSVVAWGKELDFRGLTPVEPRLLPDLVPVEQCKEDPHARDKFNAAMNCAILGPEGIASYPGVGGPTPAEARAECLPLLRRLQASGFMDADIEMYEIAESEDRALRVYVCPNGTWRAAAALDNNWIFHNTWVCLPGRVMPCFAK